MNTTIHGIIRSTKNSKWETSFTEVPPRRNDHFQSYKSSNGDNYLIKLNSHSNNDSHS